MIVPKRKPRARRPTALVSVSAKPTMTRVRPHSFRSRASFATQDTVASAGVFKSSQVAANSKTLVRVRKEGKSKPHTLHRRESYASNTDASRSSNVPLDAVRRNTQFDADAIEQMVTNSVGASSAHTATAGSQPEGATDTGANLKGANADEGGVQDDPMQGKPTDADETELGASRRWVVFIF